MKLLATPHLEIQFSHLAPGRGSCTHEWSAILPQFIVSIKQVIFMCMQLAKVEYKSMRFWDCLINSRADLHFFDLQSEARTEDLWHFCSCQSHFPNIDTSLVFRSRELLSDVPYSKCLALCMQTAMDWVEAEFLFCRHQFDWLSGSLLLSSIISFKLSLESFRPMFILATQY